MNTKSKYKHQTNIIFRLPDTINLQEIKNVIAKYQIMKGMDVMPYSVFIRDHIVIPQLFIMQQECKNQK